MTTAFQSGSFQDDSFQIDAAVGPTTGSIAATQANNVASVTGAETFSASITAAQASNTAAVTGAEVFSGSITAIQDANAASLSGSETFQGSIGANQADNTASLTGTVTGGVLSGFINAFQEGDSGSVTGTVSNPVSGSITAQQDDNTGVLRASVPDNTIEMVHGYNPKRHGKDSYWHRLLSPPLEQKLEEIDPEIAQAIEAKAVEKVEGNNPSAEVKKFTKAQAEREMRLALDGLGYAYKQAYQEIYLQVVAEMRQAQEDEQIAHIIAALI